MQVAGTENPRYYVGSTISAALLQICSIYNYVDWTVSINVYSLGVHRPRGFKMSLIKWEPLNDLEAMVDRAFRWPVLRTASPLTLGEWAPKVDISEIDGAYRFQVDVPGMKKEDISVELAGDTLVIQGHRQQEHEEKNPHFYRLERCHGGFSRRFSLPDDADLNSVHAKCEDGELIISIAKKDGALGTSATQIQIE